MGSKKKKQEKKKDFVKPKLKVGKTAPKAANYTDVSFKSKSINLPNQAIGVKDIQTYISLTKHHSASTRKEVLVTIDKHLVGAENHPDSQVYRQLITALMPVITDDSLEVRKQLLQLMKTIIEKNPSVIELNINSLILVILSAMNHLNPGIRNYSINFLLLILQNYPETLIKLYFLKIMNGFFNLLNWLKATENNSRSLNTVSKANLIGHIKGLKDYLNTSLFSNEDQQQVVNYHALSTLYQFPNIPNAYNSLNLFNSVDNLSTDLVTRKSLFLANYKPLVVKNLTPMLKEEGELAHVSKATLQLIDGVN